MKYQKILGLVATAGLLLAGCATDSDQIISQHHGLLETKLDEAAIVFLADKLIQETQRVTIEKRFADSMSKCKSPEACKAHEQQLEQARKLQDMIQSLCHITL